jgi:hypothetical protein
MRFEVPQFIDIEDKIFGPLTFKQFVYLAGAAGVAVVFWIFVPKLIGIPLIAVFLGLGVALAFYKINNKPFIFFLESAFRFLLSHKLYIWKKEAKPIAKKTADSAANGAVAVPRLSDSKLRDLAWSLDVHDSLYSDQK